MTREATPSMKYAVVERERRFLQIHPIDLSTASRVIQIEDHYVIGTRLRLRTVREPDGAVIRKLGQKIRFVASRSSALAHTTIYLDEDEYGALSGLPTVSLNKTRHVLTVSSDLDIAVDVFHGGLSGLSLAEIDLVSSSAPPKRVPSWLGVEVTDVEEFTGRALAGLEPGRLAPLIDNYRG